MPYEVRTPGKKLKKIRKEIRASQEAIADGNFKRELISQIEHEKVNLIKSTAEILVETINTIIHKKNINREFVTIEDLLEEPSEQIEKIINIYINELKHIQMGEDPEGKIKNTLDEIETFINKYTVTEEKKCEIYEVVAEIYFKCSNFEESKFYYLMCKDTSLIKENYSNVLKYLGCLTRVLYRLESFSEIITIGKYAEQIIIKYAFQEKEDTKIIYFNTSLAHSEKEQYSKSITIINKILRLPKLEKSKVLDINMHKGNCYLKLKDYTTAENIFRDIVDRAIEDANSNAAALAYLNLATVMIEINDYYQAEKFTELASQIKTGDIFNQTFNIYNAILIYIKIDESRKIDKHFINALENAILIKNQEMQRDLINKLTDYFIEHSYFKMLECLLILIKKKVLAEEIKIREISEIFIISAEAVKLKDKNKYKKYYDEGIELINYFRK